MILQSISSPDFGISADIDTDTGALIYLIMIIVIVVIMSKVTQIYMKLQITKGKKSI